MCSKVRSEVESVKKELFKAGIASEIRTNPLADALRVSRIELWVQHERDFFNASKLYAAMQVGAGNGNAEAVKSASDRAETFIEVEDRQRADFPQTGRKSPPQPSNGAGHEPPARSLEQARSQLEQEIEQMLQKQNTLATTCSELQAKLAALRDTVSETQAALEREREKCATIEKERSAEISRLKAFLETERAEGAHKQEQRERERREWEQKLTAGEEALEAAQEVLEKQSAEQQIRQREMDEHLGKLDALRNKVQASRSIG